jgi:hypothetical protein
MPQNPGNDTVTFRYDGVINDEFHKVSAPRAATNFTQSGCSMQPLSVKDKIDAVEYSQATYKCMALGNTFTQSVQAEWYIEWQGGNYRVLGAKPYTDRWGRLHHITFICRDESP